MVQFINQDQSNDFGSSLGAALGQGLGGGVQQGLQSSLQGQLKRFEAQKQFQGIEPFLKQSGLEDEEIQMLRQSGLAPKDIFTGLKLLQEQEQGANLASALGGGGAPANAGGAGLKAQHALKLAELGEKREREKTRQGEALRAQNFRETNALRKENLPHYEAARKKTQALSQELASIKTIQDINESGNLPTGVKKFLTVNPKTGELRPAAQLLGVVNEDTQRFIKTINDFTTKAKDTFGGRVTNFELQQFKTRLPSLLNTPEGRRQIAEQMKNFTQREQIYQKALQKTLQKGGLGEIPYEEAVEIAEKKIAPQIEKLKQKFEHISSTPAEKAKKAKSSDGSRVTVRSPDGKVGSIPRDQLEAALAQGYAED